MNRFQRLGELDDLEKAIGYHSDALASTPEGHKDWPKRLHNLGVSIKNRFQRLGELDDLKCSIEYRSRALELTPDSDPNLLIRLGHLGSSFHIRFERLGELGDLEKSIEYEARALALARYVHLKLPTMLSNLGNFHLERFQRLGELYDLKTGIQYYYSALTSTPDGRPDLSSRLAGIGVSHSIQFQHLEKLDDAQKAIEYVSRAIEITPDGHPDLPGFLNNLGAAHWERFDRFGDLDDLEKSIKYKTRAVELAPGTITHLPMLLSNLAGSHHSRFSRLGDMSDLDIAIEYGARSLAVIPNDYLDSCRWHFNHAMANVDVKVHSNLTIASRYMNTSLAGAPGDRFGIARRWATTSFKHRSLNLIEAYTTIIGLLPQFNWLGATTDQRYQDLKTVEKLAVDAGRAAIIASDSSLALEWLEHARCVVWNQNLVLLSPLDRLDASHPSLATRLKTVARELHSTSSGSRELQPLSPNTMASEEVGQRHLRLAKEYNELLNAARMLAGFEDFLQPKKVDGLVCAARNGPIVVINCHEGCSDALLVLPGQRTVTHLPLAGFNRQKAQGVRSKIDSSLRCLGLRERGVPVRQEPGAKYEFASALLTIWDEIVKPVLVFLGCMTNIPANDLPHITWCPTGPASFLPLHAAGDYDQQGVGSRVFDYAISSHTPTLTALLATSPSKLSPDSRVLAIGQAISPGHKPFPGTARELGYLKSRVKDKVGYSQLIDSQTTPSTVLHAMEHHDWVHLACHAHQNFNDATKSGFFLHGESNGTEATLDLTAINRRSFRNKGLAFLSACQTATGDQTLADEAVHLASGMLMAGYSSVTATMWSVVDEDAPFVADRVSGWLMVEGRLGNGEAGKALHDGVAGLREMVGGQAFGRWVPYVHIGS